MRPPDQSLILPGQKPWRLTAFGSAALSPRLWTYLACTALAVLAGCLLGKDMNWDTLEYHFYAGFSALHDRFGMDYFPAGSESYFNPYVYAPFYLLASSRLPAIAVASILAVVQSGILWLTYEIALQVTPASDGRGRFAIAVCSALFAFANPILLNLFGSSYVDVTTAELVLGGWLLLLRAIRAPGQRLVLSAGLLLGAASALKLTNSVHALSACVLPLFIPVAWPRRFRLMAVFGAALIVSFVLVCLPWSIRLQQHFGNPLFPLLNGIFRSPQFPTARMMDFRFIPDSFAEALWRPFAIADPVFMVDDEQQSPDIRYAALLVGAIILLLRWLWRIHRHSRSEGAQQSLPGAADGVRALAALGVAFVADWTLWLTASGNGRYFIAMACVAGVLAITLVRRMSPAPKILAYLFAAILGTQVLQLCLGTTYRSHIPWDGQPWFEVNIPASFPRAPTLYLSYGVQSNAFIVPFLPPGSGFVNIGGDYPLAPVGANGAKVAALIHRYWPRVRVLARDTRARDKSLPTISGMAAAADALLPFALKPAGDCYTIEIPDEGSQSLVFVHKQVPGRTIPDAEVPQSSTGYLTACDVMTDSDAQAVLTRGKKEAEQVLDRLEDACPDVFQPTRPVIQYYGDGRDPIWARRYLNTNLTAWVSRGWVQFVDPIRGGAATYIGPVAAFASKDLRILCGRRHERYFAKVASSARSGR